MSDCREMRALLSAYHDAELPPAETARVAEHLKSCASCASILSALADVDAKVESPDPGPEYWASFNARVEAKLGMEPKAEAPPVAKVLTPKKGWRRVGLPYFIPAVAAAALVAIVVRHGAMDPPSTVVESQAPQAMTEKAVVPAYPVDAQSAPVAAPPASSQPVRNVAEAEKVVVQSALPPAPVGSTLKAARSTSEPVASVASSVPSVGSAKTAEAKSPPAARTMPAVESHSTSTPALADSSRDEARMSFGASSEMALEKNESLRSVRKEMLYDSAAGKKDAAARSSMAKSKAMARMVEAPSRSASGHASSLSESAPAGHSPCDEARRLAEAGRLKDAEEAQRACLAEKQTAAVQEKGLVFLAELLDRQGRFADADSIILDVEAQFPRSRPLDAYRQQRSQVQQLQVPIGR